MSAKVDREFTKLMVDRTWRLMRQRYALKAAVLKIAEENKAASKAFVAEVVRLRAALGDVIEHTRMPQTGDSSDSSCQEAIWIMRARAALAGEEADRG